MKKTLILFSFLVFTFAEGYAQSAEQLWNDAIALHDSDKNAEALDIITRAIAIDSTDARFYDLKGRCEVPLKMYVEAFASMNKAISLEPKESYLRANRANLLLNVGEYDAAMSDVIIAIELAKSDTMKHHMISLRGLTKSLQMNYEGAYEDYQIVYKFDPTSIANLSNLATACGRMGKHKEALKYLLEAYKLVPGDHAILVNLGFQYQKSGDYKQSVEYFDKALSLNPNDPLAMNNRGYSKLKMGDTEGAIMDVNQSIALYPNNSYAYRNRALIYIEQKRIKEACIELETAASKGFTKFYGPEVDELLIKYCK